MVIFHAIQLGLAEDKNQLVNLAEVKTAFC